MCDIDLAEYCEVWREQERQARKQHKCNSCGGLIQPGERYIEHFDIFEGATNREKCCLPCDKDRKAFGDAHNVMLGPRSWDHFLEECIYDGGHDDEARRWLPALKRLRQRRREARRLGKGGGA